MGAGRFWALRWIPGRMGRGVGYGCGTCRDAICAGFLPRSDLPGLSRSSVARRDACHSCSGSDRANNFGHEELRWRSGRWHGSQSPPDPAAMPTRVRVRGIATEFVLPRFGAFESVALLVYFAFSGANSSAYSAGEFKNPRRDLPITMLASLAAIIVFYMAVQWAYIAAGAPQSAGDSTPLSAAADSVMGDGGALLLSLAAIFSIATNCLSFYIAGPRVAYAMADRGLLPETFAHVSPRFRTPDRAILLFSVIVSVMLASGAFIFLATVTSLAAQFVTLVYILAFVLLMRRSHGGHDGILALYWWPVIFIAAFFALFSIAQAPAKAFLLLAALLAVGTLLYFLARRSEVSIPEPILE